ncbi:MAG TPA: DegT/DnrJ/EryC1/StrS family aminotransferase [Chitinophagales bacterium]|nr:DegT/DnrJ/EryC1/StrS family aminotransferase [Chitinophagales bacterium]
MINLFHIPTYNIDTSKFSSLLHDKIVTEFEENFAEYVGAKYAVSLNSATNAIYLINKIWHREIYQIPSMIPPVVCNAIITSGSKIEFIDETDWVGGFFPLSLIDPLSKEKNKFSIIDSAQSVVKNIYKKMIGNELMYFSFYPTKLISSCDGGMIVSNDKSKIDLIRQMTFNGMSQESNNWERKQSMIGYKMYMNSIQAYIANENLKRLDEKKEALSYIRDIYNAELGLDNDSNHLYRINVSDRDKFMQRAKEMGIVCGIHYECAHLNPIFGQTYLSLPKSEAEAKKTVSIPFHENLSKEDIYKVIKLVNG